MKCPNCNATGEIEMEDCEILECEVCQGLGTVEMELSKIERKIQAEEAKWDIDSGK